MRYVGLLASVGLAFLALSPSTAMAGNECSWYADNLPWFPPGQTAVHDRGEEKEHGWPCGSLVKWKRWHVVIEPGYMFGALHAQEDITWDVATGAATLHKVYARTCFYNVCILTLCDVPAIRTSSTSVVNFTTWVQTDDPAEAHAAGLTTVGGVNTGLSVQAKAGCECGGSSQTTVTFRISIQGQSIEIPVALQYGEDEQMDAANGTDNKPNRAVMDEEYTITHDIDLRAKADANAVNWFARAKAWLYDHYLYIRTMCACGGQCKKSIDVILVVDDTTYDVEEDY